MHVCTQVAEGVIPAGFSGRVEVRDVSFRYPTRPSHQALADVSLTLEPGRLVALVGLSGSGKVRAALHIAHTYARMCTLVRLAHVGTHKRAHVYIKRRMRRPAWCNVCVCDCADNTRSVTSAFVRPHLRQYMDRQSGTEDNRRTMVQRPYRRGQSGERVTC